MFVKELDLIQEDLNVLQVSANKRYTAQEGAECDDEGLDSNRIDCMRDYGIPVRQGG